MNLSLGEFQAVAAKALRGAGYSWGIAAEGARACHSIAAMGFDPSHNLLRLLLAVDDHGVEAIAPNASWLTTSGQVCPISAGAALSDAPPAAPVAIPGLLEPLLLLPTLAMLASTDTGLRLQWEGGSVNIGLSGPDSWGVPPRADVVIDATVAPPLRRGRATRVDLRAESLEQLDRYAHRTYAPATEASRAAGAGAGLQDND